jgi:hypothetical protein
LLDAVCDLLAKVPFSLLQLLAISAVGGTELLAEGSTKTFEQVRNFRFSIHLRDRRNAAQQNGREPKQDKGSNEHGNQQQSLHGKWLS